MNYRPISVFSVVTKIFWKLISSQLFTGFVRQKVWFRKMVLFLLLHMVRIYISTNGIFVCEVEIHKL